MAAQDTTVVVIDPKAPAIELRSFAEPPPEVVREAVARFNDSTATRVLGSFTVASGTALRGDLAVYRGVLRVVGRITGRVTVINGSLLVGPLGTVEGDILVLGGKVEVDSTGRTTGSLRTFAEPAPVYRTVAGALAIRERPRALADLAAARATFQAGRLRTTLSLETGGTYNRIEGLPVLFGPTFTFPTPSPGEARLELLGLARTEREQTDRLPNFGFRTRLEWESKGNVRGGLGVRARSEVRPIEEIQFSRHEMGWSSFILHRDYDDYYQARGVEGYAWLYPVRPLRVTGALRYDDERTVPAADPVTVFRNEARWRPNPLVDDGHYTTVRLQLDLDTRNNQVAPTSGVLGRAWFEHATSSDVAPVALPSEVRQPIPTFRTYRYSRLWFDLRGYARVNQISRFSIRALGGGWVAGDPLPVQRRISVGGPGLLTGLRFRAQNCAPASLADPAQTALCDRMLAVQAELRIRFPLAFRNLLGAPEWLVLDRLFGGDQADLILFSDAGKAWLTGDGPGRVRSNAIPVLREWDYDLGAGFDLGGLAFYLAKSVSTDDPPRFTVRLQRRF